MIQTGILIRIIITKTVNTEKDGEGEPSGFSGHASFFVTDKEKGGWLWEKK